MGRMKELLLELDDTEDQEESTESGGENTDENKN